MVGSSGLASPSLEAESRVRALARVSVPFLLDQITAGLGPLTTREALLVLAINQANIAAMTRQPEARRLYGALDSPAPDSERRPVSINAIAASLGLPFETVRRQVRGLLTLGVCEGVPQGVIVPEAYLASPAYLASVQRAGERMFRFYLEVRGADLLGRLPRSAYATDDGVPMRGAARLLSDYILRAGDLVRALTGDIISAIVLLAVLETSLGAPNPAARSVSAIARRLSLPEETARRHAARLAEQDLCVRTARGLIIPEAMLEAPPIAGLIRDNNADVQRLFAGLAERGVIDAWNQAAGG